ncbi:MAG: YfiR/HmsC family protein [Bacteroidales bacterium]
MKVIKSLAFIALFLINASFALQQLEDKTPSYQRAEYILYIIDNIQWPNEDEFDVFTIGILESEAYITKELKKQSANITTKNGKPIKIIHFENPEMIEPTQMLYVNRTEGYDISEILKETRGNHTLLISENYEFQTSMINFIILDNVLRFEINTARIENEGLRASPLFVAKSIKSEADWVNLYLKAENLLFEEQKVVAQQNLEIERQKQLIREQLSTIKIQHEEIERQQDQILEQTEKLNKLDIILRNKEKEINATTAILEEKARQVNESIGKIEKAEIELQNKSQEISENEKFIEKQDSQIYAQLQEIEKQKLVIIMGGILSVFLIVLGYFIYRSYLIKKRANIVLQKKNEHIQKQKEEIEKQRNIATEQRDMIAKQNKSIQDSINYASRIQEAVLPPKELLSSEVKNYFILNKPKEVVSGDYYWMASKNGSLIVAAADCTGHGVPGAFMSMLGVAFLNEIVNKIEVLKANEILNMLREYVISSLRQTGKKDETDDGMDIALCIIETSDYSIQFSGANNPLYLVRPKDNVDKDFASNEDIMMLINNDNHYLYRIRGDKMPVAISRKADIPFKNHSFQLKAGDAVYLFSDGFIDQFGGPENKRYTSRKFAEKILSMQNINMDAQYTELNNEIENWKNYPDESGEVHNQIDDMLIIGIKI